MNQILVFFYWRWKMRRNKGYRIRSFDKRLVHRFHLCICMSTLILVLSLGYGKSLINGTFDAIRFINNSFLIAPTIYFALFCWGVITILIIYWIRFVHQDYYKQLIHRQRLAQMLLENHWYESELVQSESFFKDLKSSRQSEKITFFPKVYYRVCEGLIHIRVEIRMGKYQEQLLKLEKKLESGLYCELVEKELKDGFVEYVLFYDMITNRLSLSECESCKGAMQLMKNIWWEYDRLPHMLIAGGTGSGKTYFILTIIEQLLKTDAKLYILDPKNADLADLSVVIPNVYHQKDDMINCIESFYYRMLERNEGMKNMPNYRTGKNYAYVGLGPEFLIFDEYVAFMEMLNPKETSLVLSKLKQIVMLGRQSGFFLVLACQRPDAKYLGDGIRDQFSFRVALGRMSELGLSMMFGETNKDFFLKQIKGRGYVDVGTNVISEFYTPLVPDDHDFLTEIEILTRSREEEPDEET